MLRWRQQAHLAAVAVLEAKNELLDRRHELSATNERLDSVVGKLYAGRDAGMDLSRAIGAYYRIAAASAAGGALPALPAPVPRVEDGGALVASGSRRAGGGGKGAAGGAYSQGGQQPRQSAGSRAAAAGGGPHRLPAIAGPTTRSGGPRPSAVVQELSYPPALGKQRSAAKLPQLLSPGAGGGSYAQLHAAPAGAPMMGGLLRRQQGGGGASSSAAAAHLNNGATAAASSSSSSYAHVPSRVFESAATYAATAGAEAKKRLEQRQKAGQSTDRFADTAKAASMLAAVGSRWH